MTDHPQPTGLVVETQRRNYLVLLANGQSVPCVARGRTHSIACGDMVVVNLADAAIEHVAERSCLFYRADAFKQKIVAANVTQVVMVLAADPPPAEGLLQRWVVTAEATGVKVLIVANKQDLANQEPLNRLLRPLSALGYRVLALSAKASVESLQPYLANEHSVVIGQSGVGKSSIINALLGSNHIRVGALSQKSTASGMGTHTTTNSKLHLLNDENTNSWIIDSPGLQVFGLAHLTKTDIIRAFPEFRTLAGNCRFRDCSHSHEQSCALKEAVAQKKATQSRLNYLTEFLSESM